MAVRTYIEGGNKEMARNNDPHKNTWGGKNNTWGNRSRTPQNNTPQIALVSTSLLAPWRKGASSHWAHLKGDCCACQARLRQIAV